MILKNFQPPCHHRQVLDHRRRFQQGLFCYQTLLRSCVSITILYLKDLLLFYFPLIQMTILQFTLTLAFLPLMCFTPQLSCMSLRLCSFVLYTSIWIMSMDLSSSSLVLSHNIQSTKKCWPLPRIPFIKASSSLCSLTAL